MLINYNKSQKCFLSIVLKHVIVSLISGLVEYLLFLIFLLNLKWSVFEAYLLSFFISTIFAFFGHVFLTFKLNKFSSKNLFLFTIQVTLALILGYVIISLLININVDMKIAKGIQMVLTFLFSVIFGKYVSFKK